MMESDDKASPPDSDEPLGGGEPTPPGAAEALLPPAPPPVPPPLPTPALAGRLHPLTILFVLRTVVQRFLIPALILLLLGSNWEMGALLMLFMVIALISGGIRYMTFIYRVDKEELIIRQGLLEKTERHIPLGRVQDVRIEQGLLHRLFHVAEVHIETAGGQGPEASLSVLSREDAARLRDCVFASVQNRSRAAGPEAGVVRRLSRRELVQAGLTSNQAASALLLVFALFGLLDDVMSEKNYLALIRWITDHVEVWRLAFSDTAWISAALGIVILIALGLLISVIGSLVLFHEFTLSQSGEDLHRSYGLFTRRSSSLPRRRIQVLKVEETLLRRVFHLAALRADTAGVRPGEETEKSEGRDLLLPLLRRDEIDTILPMLLPGVHEPGTAWRQVSRKAIYRGSVKGLALCLLGAAGSMYWNGTLWAAWPLAFAPLIYLANVLNYRHLGYCLGERYFHTRRGWLGRATHIVPIRNIQSVVLRQTPFDRSHGVATLIIDTAGQVYTEGGPRIHNVPLGEASELSRILSKQAARAPFGG